MADFEFVYCEAPDPPAGLAWCVICLMEAKGHQQAKAAEFINQLRKQNGDAVLAASRGDPQVIPWDLDTRLNPAHYRAVSVVSQLGVVDTCWFHMAGLAAGQSSSLVKADGPIPPGLLRGRG